MNTREIKFRAYIKSENKIYDVITLMTREFDDENWLRAFVNKEVKEWEPTNYIMDWKDNIIMGYSWYDNIKWKPIFDGDVVYLAWYWDYLVEFPHTDELYHAHCESNIWEIIWNIYDNPELNWIL